jgi:molecular chaperone GrpE
MESEEKKAEPTENHASAEETPLEEKDPISELKKQLDLAQRELLYQRAEFDNYKKRMHKDQEQAIKFSNEKLIRDLNSVVDLMDRGLSHASKGKKSPDSLTSKEWLSFYDGIDLTYKELLQRFKNHGVEWVGKVGDTFDPNLHEAISQKEVEDPAEANTITDVFQKGCVLHGRLLSPARVAVALLKKE